MTTFLVNETTAIDAGALTGTLSLAEQRRVERIFVTHAHFDHVATIPFLVENVFGRRRPLEVLAPAPVIATLQAHLFNDAVWPDFSRLPSRRRAAIRFTAIDAVNPFRAGGIAFRPVRVSHIVPTYGYLLSTRSASVLFSGDTGPTRELWRVADDARNLAAIFLEVSFSNAQAAIARASRHLIPRLVPPELGKTTSRAPVYLHHMKPPSEKAIRREIRELAMPRLKFLREGQELSF